MKGESVQYRKWRDRIDSGTFTKSEVNAWCGRSGIAEMAHTGRPPFHVTNMTVTEACQLDDRLYARGGVFLTPEHTTEGIDWALCASRKVREQFPSGYLEACSLREVTFKFIDGYCETVAGSARLAITPRYDVTYGAGEAAGRFRYTWRGPKRGLLVIQ